MDKLTVKNTVIQIQVGDLIKLESDALVIPTNSRMLPTGEMRCKVLKQAGAKVQVECNSIINQISSLQVGGAVMTAAGNLKAKNIIHCVGPKMGQGHEGKKLMLATWNCLSLADEANLKSITFTPISIEMLGFNAKICADVMLPTIKKYLLEQNKNLSKVLVCLETLPDYKDFEKVLGHLSS